MQLLSLSLLHNIECNMTDMLSSVYLHHWSTLNGDTPNKTNSQVSVNNQKIVNANIHYCKKLDIHVNGNSKTLPIMYWLLKIHKTPIGSSPGLASKTWSTKKLSTTVSKVSKIINNCMENFYNKSLCYSIILCKRYWKNCAS